MHNASLPSVSQSVCRSVHLRHVNSLQAYKPQFLLEEKFKKSLFAYSRWLKWPNQVLKSTLFILQSTIFIASMSTLPRTLKKLFKFDSFAYSRCLPNLPNYILKSKLFNLKSIIFNVSISYLYIYICWYPLKVVELNLCVYSRCKSGQF